MIFTLARKACEEDGGDLVTFHNEQEKEYFLDETYNDYWFGYRKLIIKAPPGIKIGIIMRPNAIKNNHVFRNMSCISIKTLFGHRH